MQGVKLCVGILFGAASVPAWAQSAPNNVGTVPGGASEPATTQADATRNPSIEDIVVTAQRRSENLQRVPISITALGGETLANAKINDVQAIVAVTPGLQLNSALSAVTPFIRGVGSVNTSPGDEGATSIYVDGILYAVPGVNAFGLGDVERIEVLKGPQGTLFGRNAVGGLINIITKDPTDRFNGNVELGYGNYDTFSGSAYLAGGLAPDVAASVAVTGIDQGDGWGRNYNLNTDANRNREFSVRSKIVAKPGSGTKITLSADYMRGHSDIGTTRQALPGTVVSGGATFQGSIYDVYGNVPIHNTKEQYGASAKIVQDLGNFTLTSTSAYRNYFTDNNVDQDGTPLNVSGLRLVEKTETVQQELLLSGRVGAFDLTTGFFYFYSNARYRPFDITSALIPPLNVRTIAGMRTNSYAGFAQATYHITDRTGITAGLRYTRDEREIDAAQYSLAGYPGGAGRLLATTDGLAADQKEASFGKLTWRGAIDQRIGSSTLLFASVSRGFKSGLFSITTPFAPVVRPETLDAYEIGIKTDLFDRSLRLNISAFHYDYKNIQLTTIGATNAPTLVNAAKGRINGVDGDLTYVRAVGAGKLQLRASASYLDAKYTSFPNGPVYTPNPSPAGGNILTVLDVSGNDFIQSPKFTSTLGFEYAVPLNVGGNINFSGNWYHNDGYYWDVGNRVRQPAYNVVNSQLQYTLPNEYVKLSLWAKNLFNEKYYSYISVGSFGDEGAPAAPRTYGVTVKYTF